jgi:hypothetical protein
VIEIIIRIGYSTSHPCVIWNLVSGICPHFISQMTDAETSKFDSALAM